MTEVEGLRNVYVLNRFDTRLSVHSQQIRAVNVATSLADVYPLDTHIVVVGGGIGGMTVALAALRCGLRVTVLEKMEEPLHRMAAAHHRTIHPNILDWPSANAFDSHADLPVLDWRTADGATLTKRWRAEIEDYRRAFGSRFQIVTEALHTQPTVEGERVVLTFNTPDEANRRIEVDACVLCVGYGADQPSGPARHLTSTYWEADELERPTGPRHVLVSGTGDGGLADLFRVVFRDFSLETMLAEIVHPGLSNKQLEELCAAEAKLLRGDVAQMQEFYQELYAEDVVRQMSRRLRRGRVAELNGESASMFSPTASCAHRVILSQLRHVPGAPQYRSGTLAEEVDLTLEKVHVSIDHQAVAVDSAVVRHGASGGLPIEFPRVERLVSATAGGIRRMHPHNDPLRERHWGPDAFPARWELRRQGIVADLRDPPAAVERAS